jgi:tRNA G37 N-methylase Trm5
LKEILFTARKPFREEPYDELPKVENDLLIDDLEDEDCFEKPLISSSSKPDKLVLVRKTQEDKASERLLIESIVKQMSRKEENKESSESEEDSEDIGELLGDGGGKTYVNDMKN